MSHQNVERPPGILEGNGKGKWRVEMQKQDVTVHDLGGKVNGSGGQQQEQRRTTLFRKPQREGPALRQPQETRVHSLGRLLLALVTRDLRECELVMAYDSAYGDPAILHELLLLPNIRQVLEVRAAEDLLRTVWASPGCRGYLLLLRDPRPLLTFADTHRDSWDYDGKYLVVGPTLPHLLQFARTDKGRKTQHLVGAVQRKKAGEWQLYVNQLYWDKGAMLPAATWRRTAFTSDADLFPDKLADLRGAQLTVVTFVWEPSIMYRRAPDGSLESRYGVDIDAISLLSHAMNFTVRYVEPAEGELWGRQLADGSWDGIMGFLDRDEADIGVANMFLSYWRIQVVEFTAPYDLEASCFLARAEPPLPHWQALAFPFQWSTWLAMLVGLLLAGPLLHAFSGWQGARDSHEGKGDREMLGSSWLYTVGLHLRVAQPHQPVRSGTQVFVAFLWLYTMILTIAYSTNLTAFLLVKKLPATIETLKQLAESDLKVAGVGELFMTELQEASDPNVNALAMKFEEQSSKQDAYQKVLAGEAMFVENRGFVEFVARIKYKKGGGSRMRVMKECFAPNNIVMAVQRRSPLKTRVDQVIDWIREGGFIAHSFLTSLRKAAVSKEYINWSGEDGAKKEEEEGKKGSLQTPLNLDHLQGAFIFSLAGLLMAALSFLFELILR
ncbi:glutamate receptor ionotropic, delta-2-like isoform X2 [Eriocheir sinensis]|nr:glutamate receptor ionotropic, delta-2-like isoform X2 [Eriocheir sinensis]